MNAPVKKTQRCGIVSIVGRPNVGKSTLLNAIVGEKIAIVSKVPQTTRNQIRGIYTDERGQIIFIDTPGLHLGKDRLDELLIKSSFSTVGDADCMIHVVDTSEPTGIEEDTVVRRLKTAKIPIILALNKVDLKAKAKFLPEYISLWEKAKGKPATELEFLTILPISGKTKINIEKLLDLLFDLLPEGPPLYPSDTVTDLPQKIAIADIIREKFLDLLRQELPHSLAVLVESVEPRRKGVLYISARILIERESQKEIVIGRGGHILKKVGTLARVELEDLLASKVFLDLHVKFQPKWRDNPGILEDLGYEA